MKKNVLLVLFALIAAAGFSENRSDNKPDSPNDFRYQDNTAQIIGQLNAIENLYFKYLNPQERAEAIRLLNSTRALVAERSNNLERRREVNEKPKVDPNLLSDSGFDALYDSVKNEINDATKTKIILSVGKSGKITTVQLEKLILLYHFDSDRKELLKTISENIVDPVNISIVIRHLDSPFAREEMAKFFKDR